MNLKHRLATLFLTAVLSFTMVVPAFASAALVAAGAAGVAVGALGQIVAEYSIRGLDSLSNVAKWKDRSDSSFSVGTSSSSGSSSLGSSGTHAGTSADPFQIDRYGDYYLGYYLTDYAANNALIRPSDNTETWVYLLLPLEYGMGNCYGKQSTTTTPCYNAAIKNGSTITPITSQGFGSLKASSYSDQLYFNYYSKSYTYYMTGLVPVSNRYCYEVSSYYVDISSDSNTVISFPYQTYGNGLLYYSPKKYTNQQFVDWMSNASGTEDYTFTYVTGSSGYRFNIGSSGYYYRVGRDYYQYNYTSSYTAYSKDFCPRVISDQKAFTGKNVIPDINSSNGYGNYFGDMTSTSTSSNTSSGVPIVQYRFSEDLGIIKPNGQPLVGSIQGSNNQVIDLSDGSIYTYTNVTGQGSLYQYELENGDVLQYKFDNSTVTGSYITASGDITNNYYNYFVSDNTSDVYEKDKEESSGLTNIFSGFSSIGEAIGSLLGGILELLAGILAGLVSSLTDTLKIIMDLIGTVLTVPTEMVGLLGGIFDALPTPISSVLSASFSLCLLIAIFKFFK